MKEDLKEFLFTKFILVSESKGENQFETIFALAKKFGIRITQGAEKANGALIPFAAHMLGENVPEAFYRGFPKSVKELSPDELLFDQLLHYTVTYGLGDFSRAGHSVTEENFERLAFSEQTEIKKFIILDENEAAATLTNFIEDMLKGTRPLGDGQYETLKSFIAEYGYEVKYCVCKDTAIKLLSDTRDLSYAKFLCLSDVIKLLDAINFGVYKNKNLKKLNLKNSDRKFLSSVINYIFENCECNIAECFEKKALWCGLLHHIHFKAATPQCAKFAALMRGKENLSVYSEFEKAMDGRDIKRAVTVLNEGKGSGAVLRKLNYILSRCNGGEEIGFVINSIDTKNAVILIQLLIQYSNYRTEGGRIFNFTRYNRLKTHIETDGEISKRKSLLGGETVALMRDMIEEKLKRLLKGRVGKTYISEGMYNIALPLQENTASGGFGVLAKGSRICIGKGKKIRAFVYWEKVNDIDLSVICVNEDGSQQEYSWRTMHSLQSDCIAYSGDQTSGYNGGVEYFDVDTELYKKQNPYEKYLVFNANVYSRSNFADCVCRAGYMLREREDSGEAFEPKTVKTSFTINSESTFAHLFAVDLSSGDLVWLNVSADRTERVAGTAQLGYLENYINMTYIINLGTLFGMLAAEITDDASAADVVVSDEELPTKESAAVIHSYDFEKINSLING